MADCTVDMADVNLDLNETPMSRLGMASPSDRVSGLAQRRSGSVVEAKKAQATRKKKPQRATADEVTIRRRGDTAIVQPTDAAIATTHLEVGPRLSSMSDDEVLALFNATIDARDLRLHNIRTSSARSHRVVRRYATTNERISGLPGGRLSAA